MSESEKEPSQVPPQLSDLVANAPENATSKIQQLDTKYSQKELELQVQTLAAENAELNSTIAQLKSSAEAEKEQYNSIVSQFEEFKAQSAELVQAAAEIEGAEAQIEQQRAEFAKQLKEVQEISEARRVQLQKMKQEHVEEVKRHAAEVAALNRALNAVRQQLQYDQAVVLQQRLYAEIADLKNQLVQAQNSAVLNSIRV